MTIFYTYVIVENKKLQKFLLVLPSVVCVHPKRHMQAYFYNGT